MAVKIRLQRHGKKGKPYFYIVAADGRSKRDGRFIERIGNYNPNTNPATIELDHAKALQWLQNGAIPTDTARAILSYKGVLYHNHLLKGVAKGAFTQEEAEKRFENWLAEKDGKIQSKRDRLTKAQEDDRAARLAAEKEVNAAREREFAAASSQLSADAEAVAEEAAETVEEVAEEATEVVAEAAAEVTEEATEAVVEAAEAVAEVAEEAPAEDAPSAEPEAASGSEEGGEDENKEA